MKCFRVSLKARLAKQPQLKVSLGKAQRRLAIPQPLPPSPTIYVGGGNTSSLNQNLKVAPQFGVGELALRVAKRSVASAGGASS
jgi:hypothetical protein